MRFDVSAQLLRLTSFPYVARSQFQFGHQYDLVVVFRLVREHYHLALPRSGFGFFSEKRRPPAAPLLISLQPPHRIIANVYTPVAVPRLLFCQSFQSVCLLFQSMRNLSTQLRLLSSYLPDRRERVSCQYKLLLLIWLQGSAATSFRRP